MTKFWRDMLRTFKLDYTAPGAIRIVETPLAVLVELDLSGCRSPSRAKRRYAKGIRGRIRPIEKPTAILLREGGHQILYAHPEYVKALNAKIAGDLQREKENAYFKERAAEFEREGNREAWRRQYLQDWDTSTGEPNPINDGQLNSASALDVGDAQVSTKDEFFDLTNVIRAETAFGYPRRDRR